MTTEGKKRSNSIISHKVDGLSIVFKVEGAGETVLQTGNISQQNREAAMFHGFIQRIRDAAAISRDTGTGKSASPEDKLSAMRELCEHYNSGAEEWSIGRTGGNAQGGERGLLIRVLRKAGAQVEDLETWVKAKSSAEVKTLLNSGKLKPLADELRAEGAAKVDADELLSDLGI